MEENNEVAFKFDSKSFSQAIKGMLKLSAFITIVYGIAVVLNFRQYSSILIGAGSNQFIDTLRGVTYIFFYFSFVTFVPILFISSILLKLLSSRMSHCKAS